MDFGRDVTMDKTAKKAFKLLRAIKSVSVATVSNGNPEVRIADVMLEQEDGLYFITARGKPYYKQIRENQKIAACGMDKNYVVARVNGDIRFCDDRSLVDKIFALNPILDKLYKGEQKNILEAFHMYRGRGEIFDLSAQPPKRERFAFGGETVNPAGPRINDKCNSCGVCLPACPVGAVSHGEVYAIDENLCLECGICEEVCPENAVEPAPGM